MLKKFDWKYLTAAIVVLAIFATSRIYYCQIIFSIKSIFEFPDLNLYAGGIATIFTVLHKIKYRKISFNANMSFKDFRASIGDIISFIDNPITIVGALTLAKGLFLQKIDGVKFFPFLEKYELVFIFLVTLYLLFISLMDLWNNIKFTCTKIPDDRLILKAASAEEVKNKEVPKPEQSL